MNRGAFQDSLLPQTMVGSQPRWGTTDLRPISSDEASPPLLQSPPSSLSSFPLFLRPANSLSLNSLDETQELPQSWSQLLLGGTASEEVRYNLGCEEIQAATGSRATWNQVLPQVSPPKSCVTSPSLSSSVLDFSNNGSETRHMITPDHSPECNGVETGVAVKKARVQSSSSSQSSAFKARKEKLGDRITALHQLVSPFGKTDTASVLLEAIGYIRFLQNQIEALSSPYLANGSGNMRNPAQREGSCIFPEDPGQLLNDSCLKKRGRSPDEQKVGTEETKDLRSRGLCLVPVSCTLHVGSDNGADYWAASIGGRLR